MEQEDIFHCQRRIQTSVKEGAVEEETKRNRIGHGKVRRNNEHKDHKSEIQGAYDMSVVVKVVVSLLYNLIYLSRNKSQTLLIVLNKLISSMLMIIVKCNLQ